MSFRLARISRLIWIYGVGMLAFACLTSVLALYLDARFGVTEETIGYFYSYVGGLSFLMRSLLLGPIVARLGEAACHAGRHVGPGDRALAATRWPPTSGFWLSSSPWFRSARHCSFRARPR